MKVACATYLVIIMWLVLATPYWIYSHGVNSHTTWECLANFCFENTYKNVINPKVWYHNLNVHIINECSIRKNETMILMVDACAFSYTSLKCLEDVWNVRDVTNHNIHKSIYNQFVNANMKIHLELCNHMMNGICTYTRIRMMLEHTNHFFFHSQFLEGPQLNLWKRIKEKK